jgi:hypothetical protein
VPRGEYDIRISGKAMKDSADVDLSVSALAEAQLDHNGLLSYIYNIEHTCEGVFKVTVSDKESKFVIT